MFLIKGKVIGGEMPLLMGIINLTPDSFYAGSRLAKAESALQNADRMLAEGADILDIGAVSTRPGAKAVSLPQERERLMPVVKALHKKHPHCILSVDTYRSEIAREAFDCGVDIINDISGGRFDPLMPQFVGSNNIPYVMMHIHGNPENMQQFPLDKGVVETVCDFFIKQIALFESFGANRLILDPGFGFGKTIRANYELLARFDELGQKNYPLLAGLSRKSMIYKALNVSPEEALNGTIALNMLALLKGASVLRIHDVKQANETRQLFLQIKACLDKSAE